MSSDMPPSGAGADPAAPQSGSFGPASWGGSPQPTPPFGAPTAPAAPTPPAEAASPAAGPVTAPPYPTTAVPYPVTAQPSGPFPPPAPRRSPWAIVFGIVSAVLLLVSGALGTLYYLHRDEARRTSADQQAQIAALQTEVAQLKEDLDEAETRLRRAEDDLAEAEECAGVVQEFLDMAIDLANRGETELPPGEGERLVVEMMRACTLSV